MALIIFLISLCLIALSVPVLFFCLEVFLGLKRGGRVLTPVETTEPVSSIILIPAHNEASVIEQTLADLKTECQPELDHVLVVADNCSDSTANLAAQLGAEVIERFNDKQRGKGFALDYALKHLADTGCEPDVIVIFDADCRFVTGSLEQLKSACYRLNRPVQSAYRLQAQEGAGISTRIAEFAIRVKNLIRNRGLVLMGFPAVLTGTGMAFPYQALKQVQLASAELAEDMKLGVDLTLAGYPASYLDSSEVLSDLPLSGAATSTQRERWEHGHLTVMKTYLPELFKKAVQQRSRLLLGTLLDLSIPPLSLLVLVSLAVCAVSFLFGILSGTLSVILYALVLMTLLVSTVLVAWWHQGRDLLSGNDLLKLPLFVLSKLGLYRRFFNKPQTTWVRTARDKEDHKP
ncbi:MAG: glycosyltransferase family 2 protein [Nitrincola lacisaponensis]|uniref:glycosyltransferase family 2 protein n=1 Tax=Nitrincola lacisaponensis TaxID=267850 RepID=UPI00391DB0FE